MRDALRRFFDGDVWYSSCASATSILNALLVNGVGRAMFPGAVLMMIALSVSLLATGCAMR